jgi:transcriptional regulator with XRE-family HTH domain
MPTLRDVATLAGVSVATVSNVVNDARRVLPATRARVEEAMTQLNYAPAPGVAAVSAASLSGEEHTRRPTTSSFVTGIQAKSTSGYIPATPAYAVAAAADPGTPAKAARMLLRLLRAAQPISRVELASRLGVNRSTVTDIFKPLIASGLVREESRSSAERVLRLPPVALSFNADHDFFAGRRFFDLGLLRLREQERRRFRVQGVVCRVEVVSSPAARHPPAFFRSSFIVTRSSFSFREVE